MFERCSLAQWNGLPYYIRGQIMSKDTIEPRPSIQKIKYCIWGVMYPDRAALHLISVKED